MYLIAWEVNGIKNWEVISGYDAMQNWVSDVVDEHNLSFDDVVVGEITEDTK